MGEISVGEPCHNWMPEHVRRRMRAQLAALLFPPVKGLNACKCPASWLVWSDHCSSSPRRNATFSPSNHDSCVSRRCFLINPIDDYTFEIKYTASKWMKLMLITPVNFRAIRVIRSWSMKNVVDGIWSVMVYFVVALEVTRKSISASFKKDKFVLFFIYK